MRRALNDGDTYCVSSSSFILSYLPIGGRPRAARLFSRLVQCSLAWSDNFIAACLIFLDSVSSYHVKYLSSWSVQFMKNCGLWHLSKSGTSNLMFFRYWASGLNVFSMLRRLFLYGVLSCVYSTLLSLSSSVLRVSNLAFISVNIVQSARDSLGRCDAC